MALRIAAPGAVALLASIALPAPLAAQAPPLGGPTLGSGSVFGAHHNGHGGGGHYEPPGDSGGPDDGGNTNQSGNKSTPASPAGGSLAGGAPAAGTTAPNRGEPSRPNSAMSGPDDADIWSAWWEDNKFDFIELRRVSDARTGGPGADQETPAQRELRLAGLRASIRQQVLPVLRALTRSDDSAVRASAIVSLGKLRDEQSVDLARGLLSDGNLDVRRSAMLALGVQTSGRASWMLMNIADDNKTGRDLVKSSAIPVDDRGTALLSATLRGDKAAEQLLINMLGDRKETHPELLALAAGAAGLMGSVDALRPLIDIAYDTSLPQYVRSSAISALGRIGDPSVAVVLTSLLDQDLEPRRAAIVSLGQIVLPGSGRQVTDRLVAILEHDSDAASRHFAAIALGRIGGADSVKALASLLPRAKDDLRPWITLGLGLCERSNPTGTVAPLLLEQLRKEANSDTTGACLIALGLCGDEQAITELTAALQHGSVANAGYAAMALGLSGQSAAAPVLSAALASSSNPLVLRQAALGLGILGDMSAIPALLDLMRTTSNPFVASYAAIGIAFMGDSNAAGPLLDLIQREGPRGVTTTYAVAAVGQLFDQDRRPALSRLAAGDNYLSRVSAVNDLLALGF